MKKRLVFVLSLLLSLVFVLPAFAAQLSVYDEAGLFTTEEINTLVGEVDRASAGDVRFCVLTSRASRALTDSDVCRQCRIGTSESVVVLLLRAPYEGVYYYDMYTFGKADSYFRNADVDRILDDDAVYDNLKGGEFAAGTSAFLRLCAAQCEKRAGKTTTHIGLGGAILFGVVIGVIAGGITVLCLYLVYRRKQRGESYPLHHYTNLSLTVRNDIFVGSSVTRVRVQSNSSSSHHSTGHHGGHHGGHRGGR